MLQTDRLAVFVVGGGDDSAEDLVRPEGESLQVISAHIWGRINNIHIFKVI